jgi:DnaK suppressor protein
MPSDKYDDELDENLGGADDDVSELKREDFERLRKRLQEERQVVKARLDRHLAEAVEDSDNLPDEMDLATRQSDQAYLLRLADKEKKLLNEIDHALAKFERGVYGVCEGTGEAIGLKRLELRPWTRYGLEFKERLEREKGGRAKG